MTNSGELPFASQPVVDPATNRHPALSYDQAGNQLTDVSGKAIAYDGDSHVRSFTAGAITYNYGYDGEGQRVRRDFNDGTSHTTVYVYNASGQMIAEYTSDAVAPVPAADATSYLTSDSLGSTCVVTKADGSVKARYDYLPFGEEIASSIGGRGGVVGYGGTDSTKQKFTSKERDTESGLDYFLARYYSNTQGRFTSPDEFTGGPYELYYFASQASANPTFYSNLASPQSLNKYQYCYNNPLRYLDPNGHDILGDLVDFGGGIARGYVASITYGTYPGSSPNSSDSPLSLIGQAIGSVLAIHQGAGMAGGGAVATPVTGPVGAGIAVVGGLQVLGGAINLGNITNILLKGGADKSGNNSKQESTSSDGGNKEKAGPDVEVEFVSSRWNQPGEGRGWTKLKGNQGWRDTQGNIWKKDQLHKDHWDISDRKGNKIREVDFNGNQIWPDGPKNKNK